MINCFIFYSLKNSSRAIAFPAGTGYIDPEKIGDRFSSARFAEKGWFEKK